jgi:hypothetical protein
MLAGPLNKKACFTSKFFPLRLFATGTPARGEGLGEDPVAKQSRRPLCAAVAA